MARLLSLVQLVSIEFHAACNLAAAHDACPTARADRYAGVVKDRTLDDDTIVDLAARLAQDYGFRGLFCWHAYNEPLVQMGRMFGLMGRISAEVPDARYLLWTNGTLLPEDCRSFSRFSNIQVSDYGGADSPRPERLQALRAACPQVVVKPGVLDGRCEWTPTLKPLRCTKPLVELLVDVYGNVLLCCFDWRGQASPGNLFRDGLEACMARWEEMLPEIVAWPVSGRAPALCQRCPFRASRMSTFDKHARHRAHVWMAQQEAAHG